MKVDGIIMSLKARSFSSFALHPASSAITPSPRISETTILPSPLTYYSTRPFHLFFYFGSPCKLFSLYLFRFDVCCFL